MASLATIDRAIYELIRAKSVSLNLIPNVVEYSTVQDYEVAKAQLRDTRSDGTILDIFGVGSYENRGEKTDSTIIVDRKGINPNFSLPGAPDTFYVTQTESPKTFKKLEKPECSYDISYEIRLICTTTKWDRMLNDLILQVFGGREFIYDVLDDGTEGSDGYLTVFDGSVDVSGVNFIERIYNYTVLRVWLTECKELTADIREIVETRVTVSPTKSLTDVDVAGDEDDDDGIVSSDNIRLFENGEW